jgi:hypothetical protein
MPRKYTNCESPLNRQSQMLLPLLYPAKRRRNCFHCALYVARVHLHSRDDGRCSPPAGLVLVRGTSLRALTGWLLRALLCLSCGARRAVCPVCFFAARWRSCEQIPRPPRRLGVRSRRSVLTMR